jgi:hypothetical protein
MHSRGVAVVSARSEREGQPRSSLVAPILFSCVLILAAGLATWGGLETWHVGAARDFVPPGCEQESCAVERLDYIRCGSLFDQSVLANDPNCRQSLSMLRGRVIAGYTIAFIGAVGLVWWIYRHRRQRKRYCEAR